MLLGPFRSYSVASLSLDVSVDGPTRPALFRGVYLRERVGGMELGGVEGGEVVVKMNCFREE